MATHLIRVLVGIKNTLAKTDCEHSKSDLRVIHCLSINTVPLVCLSSATVRLLEGTGVI